jgi:hypothetical protein
MNSVATRTLEMLIDVRQFGLAYASHFPAGSRGKELFDLVGQHIDALETYSATQAQHARAAREKTGQKLRAVKALREKMAAIARTARAMSKDRPELQDKFRMPKGEGAQDLLSAARAFAGEVEAIKDEFIRRGMAPTFPGDFTALIGEVEACVDARAQKSSARVSATAAVGDTVREARDAMRELDAVVFNLLSDDKVVMAAWGSVSHVERAPRHAAEEATAATAATA